MWHPHSVKNDPKSVLTSLMNSPQEKLMKRKKLLAQLTSDTEGLPMAIDPSDPSRHPS